MPSLVPGSMSAPGCSFLARPRARRRIDRARQGERTITKRRAIALSSSTRLWSPMAARRWRIASISRSTSRASRRRRKQERRHVAKAFPQLSSSAKAGIQYAAASSAPSLRPLEYWIPVKPGDDSGCAGEARKLRRFRLPRFLDRAPDPFRGQRHFDLLDAEFGERIDHGIDDDRRGCRRSRPRRSPWCPADWFLPATDGRRPSSTDVLGARHRIVHERARDRLAARVVADLFHQRLADALRDAACNCPATSIGLTMVPKSLTPVSGRSA